MSFGHCFRLSPRLQPIDGCLHSTVLSMLTCRGTKEKLDARITALLLHRSQQRMH